MKHIYWIATYISYRSCCVRGCIVPCTFYNASYKKQLSVIGEQATHENLTSSSRALVQGSITKPLGYQSQPPADFTCTGQRRLTDKLRAKQVLKPLRIELWRSAVTTWNVVTWSYSISTRKTWVASVKRSTKLLLERRKWKPAQWRCLHWVSCPTNLR